MVLIVVAGLKGGLDSSHICSSPRWELLKGAV